jgi:hypothetical protein
MIQSGRHRAASRPTPPNWKGRQQQVRRNSWCCDGGVYRSGSTVMSRRGNRIGCVVGGGWAAGGGEGGSMDTEHERKNNDDGYAGALWRERQVLALPGWSNLVMAAWSNQPGKQVTASCDHPRGLVNLPSGQAF